MGFRLAEQLLLVCWEDMMIESAAGERVKLPPPVIVLGHSCLVLEAAHVDWL